MGQQAYTWNKRASEYENERQTEYDIDIDRKSRQKKDGSVSQPAFLKKNSSNCEVKIQSFHNLLDKNHS